MPFVDTNGREEKYLTTILGLDKSRALAQLVSQQGVSVQDVEAYCHELRFHAVSRTRQQMEDSTTEVHLIPYGIVRQRGTDNILVYKRPDKYGVGGIAGKHSVGFAGHVDLPDYCYDLYGQLAVYQTCLTSFVREMGEELHYHLAASGTLTQLFGSGNGDDVLSRLNSWATISVKGLIYDTTDKVGQTHLGMFVIMDIAENIVPSSGEDNIIQPHWCSVEEARAGHDEGRYAFENWSVFLLDALLEEKANHRRDSALLNVEAANTYADKYRSEEEVPGWHKITDDHGQVLWEHPEILSYRQGYLDRLHEEMERQHATES